MIASEETHVKSSCEEGAGGMWTLSDRDRSSGDLKKIIGTEEGAPGGT
jgi:hypothetical protein